MKDNRRFLICIPLALLVIVGAGFFAYDVLLAFVKYTPLRGVFGSDFVGLSNFSRVFQTPQIGAQVGNSLVQTLLTVVIGLPFGVLIALVLGMISHRPIKAAAAGMMLLIALIPEILWTQLGMNLANAMNNLVSAAGGEPPYLQNNYLLVFALSKIVPQTALCAFGGLCLNLSEEKNGALGALLVGLLPLLTVLLPDLRMNLLAGTPINYAVSDTLSSNAYRAGLMNMQISQASAMSVFGMLISLFAGLVPAILIGLLATRKPQMVKVDLPDNAWLTEGLFAVVGAVAAGAAALVVSALGGGLMMDATMGRALGSTLLTAVLAAILALIVCTVMLVCSRHCRSGIPFGIIALILSLLSVFNMSDYLLPRSMGVMNTVFPAAFGVLVHPVFIAVLVVLIACRPASDRQLLLTAVGGAAIAAAISTGDWFNPTVFITSSAKQPLSSLMRRAMMTADAGAGGAATLLVAVCAVLGVIGVALVMAGLGGTRLHRVSHSQQAE